MNDRDSTQEFVINDTLIRHCGKVLTPELINKMAIEFIEEMRRGPCAWAFLAGPKDEPPA